MKNYSILSLIIALLLLSTGINALVIGGISENVLDIEDLTPNELMTEIEANDDFELFDVNNIPTLSDRISPELMEKINIKERVKVTIITSDIAELAIALKDYDYGGTRIGVENSKFIAAPTIEIDSSAISNLGMLSGVISIFEHEEPTYHGYPVEDEFGGAIPETDSFTGDGLERIPAIQHKADRAWDNGITGDGVNIAVMGAGVDFAHPDLYGTQARITDAASPYFGWPIMFDPASMDAFIKLIDENETMEDAWYVSTTDTNSNVTHPIVIDGTNDFWRDETIGVDAINDGANDELTKIDGRISDFELKSLKIAQDQDNWYFGFDTFCNATDVNYGLYIDTDQTTDSGGDFDPFGNYVNTTGWDPIQNTFNALNATHMPEFALYFNHTGIIWEADDTGALAKDTDEFAEVTFSEWMPGTSSWETKLLNDTEEVNGEFAYSGYGFDKGLNDFSGFVEFSLPRATLNDTEVISVIMFTTGNNQSTVQDSTNFDPNVMLKENDWSTNMTTLSAYVTLGYGYYERFYDFSLDGPSHYDITTKYIVPDTFYT
ncbi:MAG: hypothetical protein KAJ33_04600, partial [Thermoplasmata archaeon]|nr:hypothetical protein [Thermoplasmata archaeon]